MSQSPWYTAAVELRQILQSEPTEVQEAQRQLDRPHYPKTNQEKTTAKPEECDR
jgi:hypothetical protein